MLKLLAILITLIATPVFVIQAQKVPQAANHDQDHQAEQNTSPSAIINSVDNRKTCNKGGQEDSPTHQGLFDIAMVGLTAALAIIALLQANAARDQAKHIVNSERAWVVVQPETVEDWKVNFLAVNGGKTPARILSINGGIHPVRRGEDELKIDWDSLNESLMSTPPEFLPPDAKCVAFSRDISKIGGFESRDRIALELIFYGKIRYLSVLESKPKIHETRWRYWYLAVKGAVPTPDPFHINDNDWN